MRSANEAIGIGSVVGMVLLYVFGGIGVGLFFMLRAPLRALAAGGDLGHSSVGALQALAAINEWPLMWMTYDTAVPRSDVPRQQVAIAAGDASSASRRSSALSFMAAETLTRARVRRSTRSSGASGRGAREARPPSSDARSPDICSSSVFFAYDVALYLYRHAVSRLVDAVRGAAPSRRARDLRAVAVGDRQLAPGRLLGGMPVPRGAARRRRAHRRSLRQAQPLHRDRASSCRRSSLAPATRRIPTQPSFARPVELIIPSIGFGLLYLYFGLLPGIVLHFTFDVVWFALPIFLADAPGIWLQQAHGRGDDARAALGRAVAALPGRRWTVLPPGERNAAWTPPPQPSPRGARRSRLSRFALRARKDRRGSPPARWRTGRVRVGRWPRANRVADVHVSRARRCHRARHSADARRDARPAVARDADAR